LRNVRVKPVVAKWWRLMEELVNALDADLSATRYLV
jgi:hypothetical protein